MLIIRQLLFAATSVAATLLCSVLLAQQPAPAGQTSPTSNTPAAPADDTTAAPATAPAAPAKPEVIVTTPLAPIPGQVKYEQLPFAPVFKGEDAAKRIQDGKKFASRTMNDSNLSWGASVQGPLQTWLVGYMIPSLTELDAQQLPAQDLPKIHSQLVQGYLQRVKSKPAHDFMVKLLMTYMKQIAIGKYHPASRYNAMLILGQLNTNEAVLSGDAKSLPEAHLPALGLMVQVLSDPKQIDVVKVAALIGIHRHAYINGQRRVDQRMPIPAKNAVLGPVFALASQETAPRGRSAEGHLWLRRTAINILGEFRDPGVNDNVANLLEASYKNPALPVNFRLAAAEAFSKLEIPPAAKLNAAQHAVQVAQMAVEIANQSLEEFRAEEERRKEEAKLIGTGGAGPGGMTTSEYGPGALDLGALGGPEFSGGTTEFSGAAGTLDVGPVLSPEEQRLLYRVKLMRRKMMARLVAVQRVLVGSSEINPGLQRYAGSKAAAPASAKAAPGARPANTGGVTYETYLAAVDKAIDKVMSAGTTEALAFDKVIEEIDAAARDLSAEVRRTPPGATLVDASVPPPVVGGPGGPGPGGPGPGAPGPGAPGPGAPAVDGPTLDGPGAVPGGPGAGPGTLDITPGGPGEGPGAAPAGA